MKRFEKFELKKPEFILGGELFITDCTNGRPCDIYDSETGIIYIIKSGN